jgi:hypothetical protein
MSLRTTRASRGELGQAVIGPDGIITDIPPLKQQKDIKVQQYTIYDKIILYIYYIM